MDREDNSQFANYLQNNAQNLLGSTVQAVAGGDVDFGGFGVGATEDIGGNNSGKFEQREEHDDDEGEWKYIKEVQQSEKQQAMKIDAEEITIGNGNRNVGNGDGGDVDGGNVDIVDNHITLMANNEVMFFGQQQQLPVQGVADDACNIDIGNSVAFETELEVIKKNDGDFSADACMLPMQVDTAATMHYEFQPQEQEQQHEALEEKFGANSRDRDVANDEDEEPSSLATNSTTTNEASSLSGEPQLQLLQQQEQQQQEQPQHEQGKVDIDLMMSKTEEENSADPIKIDTGSGVDGGNDGVVDCDFDMHSKLNPDAKEFIPNFGMSPTTPTSPKQQLDQLEQAFTQMSVGEPAEPAAVAAELQEPHPTMPANTLLRLRIETDDFVAHSPRKGRGSDMDTISLPAENEFENEASKRPHGLDEQDELIPDAGQDNLIFESQNGLTDNAERNASPQSFVDHGPETCVDLDADIEQNQQELPLQAANTEVDDDVMKRSMYVSSPQDDIEVLLNTVQPLPSNEEIASPNTSMVEKELLSFEEKENISQSPSMQEMDNNSCEEQHVPQRQENDHQAVETSAIEESLLVDTTNPIVVDSETEESKHEETSFELNANAEEFMPPQIAKNLLNDYGQECGVNGNQFHTDVPVATSEVQIKQEEPLPEKIQEDLSTIIAAAPTDDVPTTAPIHEPTQVDEELAAANAAAAAAAVAAATKTVNAASKKLSSTAKVPAPKAKPTSDVKKTEVTKKTTPGVTKTAPATGAATKPRPLTAKSTTTTTVEKKTATTSAKVGATRKPLGSSASTGSATAKATLTSKSAGTGAKPASSAGSVTAKSLTAPRTSTARPASAVTLTRKSPLRPGSSDGTAAPAPRPRPTSAGAATTKPKVSSPRPTLTTQLRKASGGAKSPLKPGDTNGVSGAKTSTSTGGGLVNRAKTTTSSTTSATTTTTTTTRTFHARPAPKSTTVPPATRRVTSTTTTTSNGTGGLAAKPQSTGLVKKSPSKPPTTMHLNGKVTSPSKMVAATASKTTTTTTTTKRIGLSPKSAQILKKKQAAAAASSSPGAKAATIEEKKSEGAEQQQSEEQKPLNGNGTGNGDAFDEQPPTGQLNGVEQEHVQDAPHAQELQPESAACIDA